MRSSKSLTSLGRQRQKIGAVVRDLRSQRRLSQVDLAEQLGISQSRLSMVERGSSSLTAEQFLHILRFFNTTIDRFDVAIPNPTDALQNALARLGALHLRESADLLPAVEHEDPSRVIRDAIIDASPRLVTALAPVLVRQHKRLALIRVYGELAAIGFGARLPWVVDNTIEAIALGSASGNAVFRRHLYREAGITFRSFIDQVSDRLGDRELKWDILDSTIRSETTLRRVRENASRPSSRWGIVSSIQPGDFASALEAADASDR